MGRGGVGEFSSKNMKKLLEKVEKESFISVINELLKIGPFSLSPPSKGILATRLLFPLIGPDYWRASMLAMAFVASRVR